MKHSIRVRLTAIFSILIIATFGICLIVNNLFLERFYFTKKQASIEETYTKLESYLTTERRIADIRTEFEGISNNLGISVILMDSSGLTLVSSATNDAALRDMFFEAILNQRNNKENVIVENDKYAIQRLKDPNDSTDYLVLLGTLPTQDFLMLRVTVNSIRESVGLANTFLTYIIFAALVAGVIVVFFMAKRITNPILELAAISSNMAELDFETKYISKGKDEIDALGENMNHLSETLEATISELQVANVQLQKDINEKIEIDEMRKEFLANVSHELKTPIALIQGYAEGLRDGIASDPESFEMYCDVIIDESQKMNHMVKELLTLNQLEAHTDNNMERFNLADLIKGKMFAFNMKAEQMGVSMNYLGNDDIPVYSDAYKIEEVLQNYISNAFNHVSGDKQITVSAERMESYTKVSVFNTGNNIPEEELEKIWIKLYKVDKARTRAYGGNGIGLSIVKAIMDSLQCEYGVENCDNGVIFWFNIENG